MKPPISESNFYFRSSYPSIIYLFLSAVCVLVNLCAMGCQSKQQAPDLGALYDSVAQYQGLERRPVIVIHGVLGSKLVDAHKDKIVWGAFGGEAVDPRIPEDLRLLTMPMVEGKPLREISDSVESRGALDRIKINFLGLPIQLSAYAQILSTLGVGGYRDKQLAEAGAVTYPDDHYSCFQFDYDWRRDISEHARKLDQFIDEAQAHVAARQIEKHGKQSADKRMDIVAHSMGGLLARYYLRYGAAPLPDDGSLPELNWSGAKKIRRVILIATPNSGSLNSMSQLIFGTKFASVLPRYEHAALGTIPSLYQLMPRPQSVTTEDGEPLNIYDASNWRKYEWGLMDPSQANVLATLLPEHTPNAQRRIAFDHLDKCLRRTRQLHQALDIPAKPPSGTTLHLFAGDAYPTFAQATAYPRKLHLHTNAPGDGTVTRKSALGDRRAFGHVPPLQIQSPVHFTSVQFLYESHIGLTKSAVFADNALFTLLEAP